MITDVYSYRFYNMTWYKRFVINGIACYLFLDWLHVRYMCLTSRLYLFMLSRCLMHPFLFMQTMFESVPWAHHRLQNETIWTEQKYNNDVLFESNSFITIDIHSCYTYLYSTYYVEYEYIALRLLINYPTLPSRCHKTKHNTLM